MSKITLEFTFLTAQQEREFKEWYAKHSYATGESIVATAKRFGAITGDIKWEGEEKASTQ